MKKYDTTDLMNWCMLATDWDKCHDRIIYPVLVQEKLNGVRAKWDGNKQLFISRSGEVWPEHVLPHLYKYLAEVTEVYDGELWSPNLKFQEITERTAVRRLETHPDVGSVSFYAFDVISDQPTEKRQEVLRASYTPSVYASLVSCEEEVHAELACLQKLKNVEGLIIRQLGSRYIAGRTETLVKLKPWITKVVTITGFVEGLGKYAGMLGALEVVDAEGKKFRVGGGPGLSDAMRHQFWNNKEHYLNTIAIRYRELTKAGLPSQPQIIL